MLIFHEAVIDLRIFMDLRQGIIVYLVSAVFCDILIEHVDDLFFQLTVLRKRFPGNLITEREQTQEQTQRKSVLNATAITVITLRWNPGLKHKKRKLLDISDIIRQATRPALGVLFVAVI